MQSTSRSLRLAVKAAALAAVMSAVVALPDQAQAWWRRMHASSCKPGSWKFAAGSNSTTAYQYGSVSFYLQNPSSSFALLDCPYPEPAEHPKGWLSTLNVYGVDNSSTDRVQAYACVTFYDSSDDVGGGGACGSAATTSVSGTGAFNLSPSRSEWLDADNADDFGYVVVYLPAKASTGDPSSLIGILVGHN